MSAPSPAPYVPAADAAREVTRLSVGVAVVLVALKAFALGASGSVAVLASLADSGLDLLASLATFHAVRWAAAPPDEDHRFGHGKGEALAALVQAGLIFASALFIGWEALDRILNPRPVTGGAWSVAVILLATALTVWLVWRQTRAVRISGSAAVAAADRTHYLSDLASNAVVLIGLASGAFLGAPGLDAAAGLIVMVWLAWGAFGLLRQSADQLLDRAAPEADRAAVVAAVLADPRVGGVHRLRTRLSGAVLMVQMHVDLDPALSFAEAHEIVDAAERRVHAAFPQADVLIHADPRGAARPAPKPGPWEPTR